MLQSKEPIDGSVQASLWQAWTVFLAVVIAIAVMLNGLGRFEPDPQFDTNDYIEFPFDNLMKSLNHPRTFVYPAVLKFAQLTNDSYEYVPWLQYIFSSLASGVFLATLLRCSWPPWLALSATLPILSSSMVLDYTNLLTPDLIAQAFGILVVSLWLGIVYHGGGVFRYGSLSILVFLAYQTKPSYLFLIVFVPVGGAIASWWLFSSRPHSFRTALKLAMASGIPFLGWCCFRWMWVGHFGLVSFGGYNIIGIAGQLLERDLANQLSAEVQPLASEILDRRDLQKNWSSVHSYSSFETQFNPMVWEISVPAASKLTNNDTGKMNYELSRLSKEILLHRPTGYAIWIALAAKHAVTECMEITIRNPMVVVALAMMLAAHALRWRKICQSNKGLVPQIERYAQLDLEYQTIVWLALGYASSALLLVILVEAPISRYCAPAAVFLPSILVMLAADMFRRLR